MPAASVAASPDAAPPVSFQAFADPQCPKCHGKGKVKTGPGLLNSARCLCSIIGQHAYTAERMIRRDFPGRAAHMTFDTFQTGDSAFNERALKVARNFVDNYERASQKGWLLGFWGLPSAGKTHLAYAIAIEVTRRYLARAQVLNVVDMLRQEKKTWDRTDPDAPKRSPLDVAMNAPMLVLDDLGAEYTKASLDSGQVTWVYEQLYLLLDRRIMANRPTIYTTNLSPSDLERRLDTDAGMRVWGRIERAQVAPPIEVKPVQGVNRQDPEDAKLLFG